MTPVYVTTHGNKPATEHWSVGRLQPECQLVRNCHEAAGSISPRRDDIEDILRVVIDR